MPSTALGWMRLESMLSTRSRAASDDECGGILDKLDFLLKVQRLADGVDQVEPLLEDLVDQVRDSVDCWAKVSERFIVLVHNIDPWSLEILQYCMHELRWREIFDRGQYFLQREENVGRRRLYERLIQSFDDDWSEREFFRRYSA
jgi:hypothetical protein